jgi:hypothetical protein
VLLGGEERPEFFEKGSPRCGLEGSGDINLGLPRFVQGRFSVWRVITDCPEHRTDMLRIQDAFDNMGTLRIEISKVPIEEFGGRDINRDRLTANSFGSTPTVA